MNEIEQITIPLHDVEDEYDYDELEIDDYEFIDIHSPFDEEEEIKLAMELLSVTNDEELEQFLGKIFKKIGRGIKKFVHSPVFRKLGHALKGIAKTVIPIAGSALGTVFGGPVGGLVGGQLSSLVSKMFELEGDHDLDTELELARKFVRFAGTAAQKALKTRHYGSPRHVVKAALKGAARKYIKPNHKHMLTRMRYPKRGRWICQSKITKCNYRT